MPLVGQRDEVAEVTQVHSAEDNRRDSQRLSESIRTIHWMYRSLRPTIAPVECISIGEVHAGNRPEVSPYSLTGVVSNDLEKAFKPFDQDSDAGKWKVFFFWPKDFTFVCPTEIAAFGKLDKQFPDRDAQLYGVSIDSEFVHLAWRKSHEDLKTCRSRCSPTSSASSPQRSACSTRKPGRAARDLHRRPAGRHPLRVRDRPVGRPQPRRGAARARCAADRRALPVQLEAGRGHAQGRLSTGSEIRVAAGPGPTP